MLYSIIQLKLFKKIFKCYANIFKKIADCEIQNVMNAPVCRLIFSKILIVFKYISIFHHPTCGHKLSLMGYTCTLFLK